jgi:Na+-translocating ferredoxin:NAD+ oxidoreductase RnfE subunit
VVTGAAGTAVEVMVAAVPVVGVTAAAGTAVGVTVAAGTVVGATEVVIGKIKELVSDAGAKEP